MRARVRENYEEVIQKANNILNIFSFMFSEGKTLLTLKEIITEINNLIEKCSHLISNMARISKDDYDANNLQRLSESTYSICIALTKKLTDLKAEKEESKDKDKDCSEIVIIKKDKAKPSPNTNISFHEWYENQRKWNEERGRVLHPDHISAPMRGPR